LYTETCKKNKDVVIQLSCCWTWCCCVQRRSDWSQYI